MGLIPSMFSICKKQNGCITPEQFATKAIKKSLTQTDLLLLKSCMKILW